MYMYFVFTMFLKSFSNFINSPIDAVLFLNSQWNFIHIVAHVVEIFSRDLNLRRCDLASLYVNCFLKLSSSLRKRRSQRRGWAVVFSSRLETIRDDRRSRPAGYNSPAIRHDLNLQSLKLSSLRPSSDIAAHVCTWTCMARTPKCAASMKKI